MYILIDILVIAFVLGFIIYGAKRGFFESTVNVALVLACVGGAGILAVITVNMLFVKWGWLNETAEAVIALLGNSKIAGMQQTVSLVATYIAYGLLVLLCFIVYNIVLHLLRKLILKISKGCRKCKLIKFLDNFLGGLVSAVVTIGLVLVVMAFFHTFLENGILFTGVNEALLATDLLSYVYEYSPLNEVFDKLEIAKTLEELYLSFMG